MPMVFSELNNDGYEYGEGLILVSLEYVEEVVILEETHRTVSYLKVVPTNAFRYALK